MEDFFIKYPELQHLLNCYNYHEDKVKVRNQIKRLIEEGVPVDIEVDGWTFVHVACKAGDVELVKFLIPCFPDHERFREIVDGSREPFNEPLLHLVCRKQCESSKQICEVFLEQGADVNDRDEDGRTAVHVACSELSESTSELCTTLIQNGADVNGRDEFGRTALHEAYSEPSEFTSELGTALIQNGADVNGRDEDGSTALHMACCEPSEFTNELSTTLIQNGADVNSRDEDGRTALHVACGEPSEFTSELCTTLIQSGADVNGVDEEKDTPLHRALGPWLWSRTYRTAKGATVKSVCENLLKHGAKINTVNRKGETPIALFISCVIDRWVFIEDDKTRTQEEVGVPEVAAQSADKRSDLFSSADICDWLINSGADVNTRSAGSKTLFHIMVEKYVQSLTEPFPDKPLILKELLRVIAKNQHVTITLNSRNEEGNTPLHTACKPVAKYLDVTPFPNFLNLPLEKKEEYRESLVECLISCGSKVNARNDLEQTPLQLSSSAPVITYLLKSGADLSVRDENGNTPLMTWASSCDVTELDSLCSTTDLKEIIHHGIDSFFVNKKGDSVLDIILSRQMYGFLKSFLEAVLSADPRNINRCDAFGNTFLHVVAKCDDVRVQQVIEMLLQKGADPNCVNKKGETPMYIACFKLVEIYKGQAKQLEATPASQTKVFNRPTCLRTEIVSDSIQMDRNVQETEDGRETPVVLDPDYVHNDSNKEDEINEPVNEEELMESVSAWVISLLKKYGGDPLKPNASDKTCVDIVSNSNFKILKELLETPIKQVELPPLLTWEQKSVKHRSMLGQVARQRKSEKIETFHYHRQPIGSGAFGHVHVGINGEDGREIALKKVELLRLDRPEDKREIQHLLLLKDCEQIVKYHSYCKDRDFLYIFLELMEGSLEELVCQKQDHVELCRDVMSGLYFLHKNGVLHRDIKPGNILYKTEPRLCLKLADFGLSTKASFNASAGTRTVMHSKAGTRCWMATEIHSVGHSEASDVFAAGLVLYYILDEKNHAFGPKDETGLDEAEIQLETEFNIRKAQLNLSDKILIEASHLLKLMLQHNKDKRPSATDCLTHPFFWSRAKKKEFLCAVGNQPEIAEPRPVATARGLTSVEQDLENELGAEFSSNPWDIQIPQVYLEITSMPRGRRYCTTSAVDLVRFVRNSYSHVSGATRSRHFQLELLDKFAYLDIFPTLVITVYDIVMKYAWNGREEIKYVLQEYS